MQVKVLSAPCKDSSPIIDNEQELSRQFPLTVDVEENKIRNTSAFSFDKVRFSNVCAIFYLDL